MALDLSSPALLNAGGGLFFVLLGAFALVVGWRGGARARLLATTALAFGSEKTLENILVQGDDRLWGLEAVLCAVAAVSATLLCVLVLRKASPRRRLSIGLLLGPLLLAALAVSAAFARDLASVGAFGPYMMAHSTMNVAFLLLAAACAVAYPGEDAADGRGLAAIALGFGLYATLLIAPFPGMMGLGVFGGAVALWLALMLLPLLWVAASGRGPPRVAQLTAFALLAAGVLAVVLRWTVPRLLDLDQASLSSATDFGLPGILRAVGALLLTMAVLRHGLLGVELPRLSQRRGPVVAASFALLIIVTQVAQNFLSDQYGLVMGGIVAGAFMFAAHPLQRMLEGAPRRVPVQEAAPRASASAENERVYAMTLRRFLVDGRLSREEEVALMHLADELRISARRAIELRHEIERAPPP